MINPRADAGVRQGVTLEVIGNCGMSVTPLTEAIVPEVSSSSARFDPYGTSSGIVRLA